MIIHSNRLRSRIMSALSDEHMHKILISTAAADRSVNDIIREQDMPHSTAYKKITQLMRWGLLVRYRSEIIEGKKVAFYKSTFRSIKVTFEGPKGTKVEAEPNSDAIARISLRFYDL